MAYRALDPEDVVLSSDLVSTPVWTGNTPVVSKQDLVIEPRQRGSLSGLYYLDIYKYTDPAKTEVGDAKEVQFSVAYADKDGSGSAYYNKDNEFNTYSKTIYGQYRSLVLGDEDSEFYLTNEATASNNFIAITIDRARYKERLMLGTLKLSIRQYQANGAEKGYLTLTDDSAFGGTVKYLDSGRLFKLVREGSVQGEASYGFFLPDIGVILIDCEAIGMTSFTDSDGTLNKPIRWNPWATEPAGLSAMDIFFDKYFGEFEIQSEETITSNYVFVRARNAEFNYSTNPSNIVGSGELRHDVMINQPQAFITSVGLYNSNNDLLAVAKLSRPLLKDFTKEAIIRIKIDY